MFGLQLQLLRLLEAPKAEAEAETNRAYAGQDPEWVVQGCSKGMIFVSVVEWVRSGL